MHVLLREFFKKPKEAHSDRPEHFGSKAMNRDAWNMYDDDYGLRSSKICKTWSIRTLDTLSRLLLQRTRCFHLYLSDNVNVKRGLHEGRLWVIIK